MINLIVQHDQVYVNYTFVYDNDRGVSMGEQKKTHGGKRDGAGGKPIDSEKRVYTMRLTPTEKEIIDTYRASKGLDK